MLADAEIAESTAKADAEQAQAEAAREGQVANERAETVIRQRENELARVKFELDAKARSEEERAEQAALAARARAEQELQQIRSRLENLRRGDDFTWTRVQRTPQGLQGAGLAPGAFGESLQEVRHAPRISRYARRRSGCMSSTAASLQ